MVLAEAELIAHDILATVGEPVPDAQGQPGAPLHYRDIAILLPVGKNVADKVELVLGRMGIPVYCEGGGDPMASDEVDQVLQHLTLLDNLANDVALLSELRSPLFEMTERELAAIRLLRPQREASFLSALQAAAREARRAPRRALPRRAGGAGGRSGSMRAACRWPTICGASSSAAGCTRIMGRSRAESSGRPTCACSATAPTPMSRSHTDGLHGFVEAVRRRTAAAGSDQSPAVMNPWEDVVRIMTIHKSKGLEFPTVYVMGLGGPLLRRAQTRALSLHGEIGFGLGYVNEKARTRRTTLLQGAVALRERSAERAERARVLYVAMTRPKVRLVLVGSLKNPDACLRLGRSGGVYGVREARSMLDWLLQSAQPGDGVTVEQRRAAFHSGICRETAGSVGVPHTIHRFSTEKRPVAHRFPHGTSHYKAFHPARRPAALPAAGGDRRSGPRSPASPRRKPPAWTGPRRLAPQARAAAPPSCPSSWV